MTNEQKKRIAQAIEETKRLLKKERSYTPNNLNKEIILLTEKHLKKLESMLAA